MCGDDFDCLCVDVCVCVYGLDEMDVIEVVIDGARRLRGRCVRRCCGC